MKTQTIFTIESLRRKANRTTLLIFFLQLVIALAIFGFYLYRQDLISFPIDLSFLPKPSKPNNYKPFITREILNQDILKLASIPLFYYFPPKILFKIGTKYDRRKYPNYKKADADIKEIEVLYVLSWWQYAGLIISIGQAIIIYEEIGFGSGLLSKDYIIANRESWTSPQTLVFILFVLSWIVYSKRWKKMLANVSRTEE